MTMRATLSCAVVLFFCCRLTICSDKSKWIYPHDMGDASVEKTYPSGDSECVEVMKRMTTCESELEARKSIDKTNKQTFLTEQFSKFLKNLSRSFCYQKLDDDKKFQITFKFTQEQCMNLATFAEIPSTDPQKMQEIQETLADFISHSKQVSDYQSLSRLSIFTNFCVEHFHAILTVVLFATLSVNAFWVLSRVVITKRLVFAGLVFLFLISIPWNWWYMYKKKEAGKMAAMAKASTHDPCGRKTFFQSIGSFFSFQKDECTLHAEASNIHAAIEVTPLMAVSVTISRVFLEPLEYVGMGINKLISSTTEGLPFALQMALSILVFFMVILSLFLVFGYNFRTVFFTIGPSDRRGRDDLERVLKRNEALENKIHELENKLRGDSGKAITSRSSGGGDSEDSAMSPSTSPSIQSPESVFSPSETSTSSPD